LASISTNKNILVSSLLYWWSNLDNNKPSRYILPTLTLGIWFYGSIRWSHLLPMGYWHQPALVCGCMPGQLTISFLLDLCCLLMRVFTLVLSIAWFSCRITWERALTKILVAFW
jgi:hypothetical protein